MCFSSHSLRIKTTNILDDLIKNIRNRILITLIIINLNVDLLNLLTNMLCLRNKVCDYWLMRIGIILLVLCTILLLAMNKVSCWYSWNLLRVRKNGNQRRIALILIWRWHRLIWLIGWLGLWCLWLIWIILLIYIQRL